MKSLITILFILLLQSMNNMAMAQNTQLPLIKGDSTSMINVFGNEKLKSFEITPNKTKVIYKPKTAKGFRLIIYNGSSREEATAIKSKMIALYPREYIFMNYQNARYKVKVGNFTNKADAEAFRDNLQAYFNNIQVISDIIIPKK